MSNLVVVERPIMRHQNFILPIVLAVIFFAMMSCQSATKPPSASSSQLANEDVIKLGMSLNECHKILDRNHITNEPVTLQVAYPDDQPGMTLRVSSDQSNDALELDGWGPPGVLFLVKQMNWHMDFKDDAKKPRAFRKDNYISVDSLTIAEIKAGLNIKD